MKKHGIVLLAMAAAALGLAAFAACGLAACNDTGDTPGGDTPGGNAGNEYLVFETLADGSLQVSADSGKEMPEEIVIPSEYEGKPVTAVKAQGFALNRAEGLERVVIPEGVKSIGEKAFYNLITLESAVLPDSLIEMGMYAFAGCTALQDIEFGSGLSIIPVGAFGGCAIASLTLPETVTDIYFDAFRGCRELTGVTLPDSVTYLGSSVFAECEALTEVTLPKGLTSIENATFKDCGSLTKIEIPAGVKSIGSSAFEGCALKEVVLPDGVERIGDRAFYYCDELASVVFPDSISEMGMDVLGFTAYYDNEANWKDGVLFAGCHLLDADRVTGEGYTVPKGTRTIAGGAFDLSGSLKKGIVLNEELVYLGREAFKDCAFEEIAIPESVTTIEADAFFGCDELEWVVFEEPENWTRYMTPEDVREPVPAAELADPRGPALRLKDTSPLFRWKKQFLLGERNAGGRPAGRRRFFMDQMTPHICSLPSLCKGGCRAK